MQFFDDILNLSFLMEKEAKVMVFIMLVKDLSESASSLF